VKFLLLSLFLLFSSTLFADRVEITSTSMKAENLKKEVHFIGNAKVKKGEDWLHADTVIVYFDDNNQTNKYEAIGNVTFELHNDKNNYLGEAQKVTYHPLTLVYVLEGKSVIDDIANKRHVHGDIIHLNMKTGDVKVKGSQKKPVKFIFDTEDKK
jgi:lipopolysaccharide export system protein LptA